jgi:eukaryotic-like serine/threonine-protein kinase
VPQLIAESDGAGGTWNTDGVILFGGRFDLGRRQIMRVSASGGTPSAVLALDTANGETMQGNPVFLPDGRHFLYQSYTRKAPELVFASLDGSIRKRLFAHSSSPVSFVAETTGTGAGWLLFVSQNRLFAQPFDSSKGSLKGERQLLADSVFNGPSWSAASNGLLAVWHNQTESNQLQWLNRDGSLVETIGDPGAFFSPRLSPEGRLIVYQKDREIWLHDTTRKIASRVTEEWASRPMWSPDGKTILYDTVRDGSRIAVARHANGAGGERLLYKKDGTATGGVVGLSRDEKWAVLFENLALHFQHLGDGRMVRFPETAPSIGVSLSPDSRWLVYSVISSVQREVFVQSVPVDAGGSANAVGRFQISNAGGTQPVWRSDGKEIFYISLDGRMMAVGVESGADFFRPGPAKPLFQTRVSANNWSQYDVTPDGRRFLIAQPAEGSKETPISVIVNWTRLLTKP